MKDNESGDTKSIPTTVESFVSEVTEAFSTYTDAPDAVIENIEEAGEHLAESVEREISRRDEQIEELQEQVDGLADDTEEHEVRLDSFSKWKETETRRVRELQSREFVKGGHLRTENVEPTEIDIENGKLERITKDDGKQYFRAFGEINDDPFDSDNITCSYDDLLPIQQLARLPDEMLAEQPTTDERATWVWQNREEWMKKGCNGVKRYIDASDLATELYLKDDRIGSRESAQTIAGKVMHRVVELSKTRTRVERKNRRKNGAPCTEKRLIVPEDAEIPGSNPTPRTEDSPPNAVVSGD